MLIAAKRGWGLISGWYARAKLIGSVFRRKSFDANSSSKRSIERYRRIALTSVVAVAARGIGILTSLISVPLTLHYLGDESYGLWMTITSILFLLNFADLGIGNGLLNAVAECSGRDDEPGARAYISSAFYVLSALALIIIIALSALYRLIPWEQILNIGPDVAKNDAAPAAAVLIISCAISMPLGIVQKVNIGFQEGYTANLWGAVGNLAGLGGLIWAVHSRASLVWLTLAVCAGPAISLLANGIILFGWRKPQLRPSFRFAHWAAARHLFGTGIFFFVLQILTLMSGASDNIIIAHTLGLDSVTAYSVAQKLFTISQIAQYFIAPLWPAFVEALARKDHDWARRAVRRALFVGMAFSTVVGIVLVFAGNQIIAKWTGKELSVSMATLLGFGAWGIFAAYGGIMSTLLNSGSHLRGQVWFQAVACIAALVLKLWLAPIYGISGVIWGGVTAYLIFYAFPAARLARSVLNPE